MAAGAVSGDQFAVLWEGTQQCSRFTLPNQQRRHVLVTHVVLGCRCWKSPLLWLHPISPGHAMTVLPSLQIREITIVVVALNRWPQLSRMLFVGMPVT